MKFRTSFLVKSAIVLGTLISSLDTFAQNSKPCIDSKELAEAQQAVTFLKTYNPIDLCNPDSRTYKLAEAVIFMKNFRWDTEKNKSNPLDRQIMPTSFWDFFTAEPKKTLSDVEDTPGNAGVVAASLGALKDGNIYLMKAFYEEATPPALRAVVLLHEAQHFHEAGHVLCQRAGGSGGRNCDESLEDRGSWAVTMEGLSKLMISASPSPLLGESVIRKLKQEMLQMSYFVFNENTKLNATYMIDENNQAFIFDGIHMYPTRAVLDSKVISRYLTLLSFPNDLSTNSTLNVFKSELSELPPTGGVAVKYSNQRQSDRKPIVDIFNLEECTASLYEDYASFNDWPNILINGWTPKKVFCGSEMDGLNKTSLYVTDADGKSHEFSMVDKKVITKDLEIDPFKGIKMIATLKNTRLALSDDGRIYTMNDKGAWEIDKTFADRKFKVMTRSFLWIPLVFDSSLQK